jgi:YidC/Oxa1 family membrane protein insertase
VATIEALLYPIIALMTALLTVLHGLLDSYGFAIIGVSAVVRLVIYPITKSAGRLEQRERLIRFEMAPELAAAKANRRGRERFEAIDAIYQKHGYHPIKSLASLIPLLLQIPFLLSALFLFVDYPPLVAVPFLFIDDLSQPDRLLPLGESLTINLLPITLTAVAVLDSVVRPGSTVQTRLHFLIVAVVLLVLIYPLPAAVCIYWLASNCYSSLDSLYSRVKSRAHGGE